MSVFDFFYILIPALFFYSPPLIFTALGGVFSERSGVVNIALEGLMIIGACAAVIFNLSFADVFGEATPWLALLVAIIVGGLFSLLHAVASISLRADQVVSGMALNMLALGGCMYLIKKLYNAGQSPNITTPFAKNSIPGLEDIPFIGPIVFKDFYWTFWLSIAVAVLVWVIIYKTSFGLRLRAVGEHPMAADTAGVNVARIRYIAVTLSGMLGALGGAVFAQTITSNFYHGTIAGQGFIALAAMIFGKWHPLGALGAALFFGLAQSLGVIGSFLPGIKEISPFILEILPYVLTILALAGFIGRADAPAALGTPYIKGKR